MKLVRYRTADGAALGAVKDDGIVPLAALGVTAPTMLALIETWPTALETIRAALPAATAMIAVADAELLAPIEKPGKYLAIGMNYGKHLEEADRLGVARSTHQVWFNKQTTCIVGPFDAIEPGPTEKLDYEVELGVVIGTRAKNVSEADALDHVFGYFVANDVSARDYQFHSQTMMMGKSFDTHGPCGPWLPCAPGAPLAPAGRESSRRGARPSLALRTANRRTRCGRPRAARGAAARAATRPACDRSLRPAGPANRGGPSPHRAA